MKAFTTVFPCDINETKSISPFAERIKKQSGLYVCTGTAKVGKTAFVLKILKMLTSDRKLANSSLIISFDDTIDYWIEKLQLNNVVLFSSANKKHVSFQKVIREINEAMLDAKTHFIVLDGINSCEWKNEDVEKLFASFIEKNKSSGLAILVTCRSKEKMFTSLFSKLKRSIENIELWNLKRPEYFVQKFGETLLTINKNIPYDI